MIKYLGRDFTGGPVVRTPGFHCRGPGIDPCTVAEPRPKKNAPPKKTSGHASSVPGVLLCALSHLILTATLQNRYYYSHFTSEATKRLTEMLKTSQLVWDSDPGRVTLSTHLLPPKDILFYF